MWTGINFVYKVCLVIYVCLFQSIGYVYTGLMQAVGASNKVYIDRKPDIPNSGKLSPATLEGRLDFKDVTFAYPTRPEMDVLKVRMLLDFDGWLLHNGPNVIVWRWGLGGYSPVYVAL